MSDEFQEQREFLRIDHAAQVEFRELKTNKYSNKANIQTKNVSASGILFNTTQIPPALSSIVWIIMDDKMVNVCSEIEEDLVIVKNGILARVVRISEGEPGVSYDVGACFLRRKNMSDAEVQSLTSNQI
ncbi:MAG: hypothetical protein HQL28_00155 [Candidatus Omnitrophica bacterium]|nr:hypothetical protein [Candidatus Omnitrophota bacterium]